MPKVFTVAEAMSIVRDKLQLSREQGVVLMAEGKYILKLTSSMMDVYNKHRDEDGFLYLVYSGENIYG